MTTFDGETPSGETVGVIETTEADEAAAPEAVPATDEAAEPSRARPTAAEAAGEARGCARLRLADRGCR